MCPPNQLEVVSKPHLTPNPPKVYPPRVGGQVAALWVSLVSVRGPSDTEVIRPGMLRFYVGLRLALGRNIRF